MSAAAPLFDPRSHVRAGREFVQLATRHRQLLLELARRDVRDRFAGHALGATWAVANPLFLMLLYVGLFTFVFPARGFVEHGRARDLSVYILSGLIPWLAFQEVLGRSTTAITSNASLVKQIVFPIEVLPFKIVLGALPAQIISTACLVLLALWTSLASPMIGLFPLALTLQVIAMVGVALLLASVGAFVKDLRELVTFFSAANLFLQPILYAPAQLPAPLAGILWLNPFSHLTWVYQDVFFFGRIAHPWSWVVLGLGAPIALVLGSRIFEALKHRFGDVL